MAVLFTNNANTTIGASINSGVTSVTLAAGTGALFPNPTGGDYFMMTFKPASPSALNEIVKVTARASDVCTIVRGQEGSTAQAWSAGDVAAALITAGGLQAMLQQTGVYATDTGAVNAYAIAPSIAITSYQGGQSFVFVPTNVNTGASTIAVSGLAAKSIVHPDGTALLPGDIPTGGAVEIVYQAAIGKFVLLGFFGVPFTNAASGSLRIPGTPFILQWAAFTTTTPGVSSDLFTGGFSANDAFSWPATFPNSIRGAWATYVLSANGNCTFGLLDRTTTGGTLYTTSGQNSHGVPCVIFGLGT